jgi:hypothetical protein
MTIEIIARGPSRVEPRHDTVHYWLDVAYKGEPLRDEDRVFALHDPRLTRETTPNCVNTIVFYPDESRPKAIVMHESARESFVREFGRSFGSSVAWAMALAIRHLMSRPTRHILLNGVDCEHPREQGQRESIAYMAGFARARGIQVEKIKGSKISLAWGAYPE